jgi:hypothetical protein
MSFDLQKCLQDAVEIARHGQKGYLQFEFDTRAGAVEFLAEISLVGDTILCDSVCIYPKLDPPGIQRATISKELRAEWRKLQQCAQDIGFAKVRIKGVRGAGSSSAKPGKKVDIVRGRKT